MKTKADQNLYTGDKDRANKYSQGPKIKEDNMDAHVDKVLKEVERMCRLVGKEFSVSSNKVEG